MFYGTLASALSRLLIASVGGAVLVTLLFIVPAFQVPAIFGREDPTHLVEALRALVFWNRAALVVGVTTVSALFLAGWAYKRVKGQVR